MTVADLIERLQRLPGDADLRCVVAKVHINSPYAASKFVECEVTDVGVDRDVAQLFAWGYLE